MSKQNQTEWRCPYCDGLNDWQDEVCQICGDGKRDEVVSSGKTASAARSGQPQMQYQTQNQNTYSQEPTRRDVQQERRQSAPEPETRFSQREPEVKKPEPEVRKPEPEITYSEPEPSAAPVTKTKRKKHWGLIPVAVVLIAGGIYGFSVHKANTLVNDIDFKLLQNAPYASMDKFKSWAESQGYEVTTSKDGTGFFTDYSVDPGKSDWNISVSEGSNGIEITYKADGQNLNAVYKKLDAAIKERNWKSSYLDSTERPTFKEGITGKKYRNTQFWIDGKNNWYELAMKDREVTITREDAPVSSEELAAEVDLDFMQNSPQGKIQDSESWLKQKGYQYTFNETKSLRKYDIMLPQSSDWNVFYHEPSAAEGFTVVYNAKEKDCTDLSALYESLKTKLENSGFTIVCQEAETGETTDGSSGKFMVWQDVAGKLYDLSLDNSWSPFFSEVNLVKENSDKEEGDSSASYDVTVPADQLNMAALLAMPMNSYVGDENWKQKFNESYGNVNFQPEYMTEGDKWCRVYFRYYPLEQENKKEILRYLKNGIQDATGQKMKLETAVLSDSSGSSFSYAYEIETTQSHIELSSISSSGWIQVTIEGSKD